MKTNIEDHITDVMIEFDFSGTVLVKNDKKALIEKSYGYANRSEQIVNSFDTRFGIASGCKLFTAIAICQLVEDGLLSFDTKLKDCLNISFPYFDKDITIHHLLTHTAGIPDYFDEEVMDEFEELWIKNPMYLIRSLKDFLPLFQNQPMKLGVGERFHYNNAGYILLGLIIEQTSKIKFADYIKENIFNKSGMTESDYFEFDSLPIRTALGYIDFPNGTWKTNIYSLPVKGGSDGGAFVTVNDIGNLWDALINNELLSEEYTHQLLTPYINTSDDDNSFYGYGIWIKKNGNEILKYHIMGYDPGVSFHSAFYPKSLIKTVICSNKSEGAYDIMKVIEEEILK
ncbi:penicillin-binding protein [Lysinibacillus sp. 2017]|uniref:serine hydrolase domain-containing protein n=1 Tax=unclassified Lysinibacillus TaxID=2636778 RepID=UPI000D52911B|nr:MULTISPECIES: serine hydrolase [unclassified Lysinibacillus]AWE07711.1 penicillin-binding protein [Lysinibacillus sp. 2017]TGN30772.1 class C beta-lactamase-related serine hydrolase [Lysinibacillus sp. S2017]